MRIIRSASIHPIQHPHQPQRSDGVRVPCVGLCDAACEEVPHDHPAIVTSNGQQRPSAVEGAGKRLTPAVEKTLAVLGIALTVRF